MMCRACEANRQPSGAENSAEISKRLREIGVEHKTLAHGAAFVDDNVDFLNQLADQLDSAQKGGAG